MPVIHRGLRDRVGETKKRAARIAGNMASLVNDPKVKNTPTMYHTLLSMLDTYTPMYSHGAAASPLLHAWGLSWSLFVLRG